MKFYSLNQFPMHTEDFFFRWLDRPFEKDTLVIHNPMDAIVVTPVLFRSRKTLQEHIEYIQRNHLKKAIVVGEDIGFLRECPSLEYLWVLPAISAEQFDYSPIYELPNLKWLQCETMYGLGAMYDGVEKVKVSSIDYARLPRLKRVAINGAEGHKNVHTLNSAETLLLFSGYPKSDSLSGFIPGESLTKLRIIEAPIRNLEGIEVATQLQRLDLSYNRRLTDISALRHVKETLVCLEIDACGKIKDFSVLNELHNLEYLILKGSNKLPNLQFLKNLPKLKYLHVTMNIEDGDLKLCQQLPYARIKNRKHYTHKDQDMPKSYSNIDDAYSFDDI